MNCPCKDCICMPVCRHKKFFRLKKQCFLVSNFINMVMVDDPEVDTNKPYNILYETLKPLAWRIDDEGWLIDTTHPESYIVG